MKAYIATLEAAGKLRRFVPRSRQAPKRRLYLADLATREFDDPSSATNVLVGKGFIESSMTRWVLGERVYGDARKGRFLTRLRAPPPEIWEIRVTEPVTQARLLGRFAEPNTLVLIKLHTRRYLGKSGSDAWSGAMAECHDWWSNAFPAVELFSASDVHAYVTENCDDFPI